MIVKEINGYNVGAGGVLERLTKLYVTNDSYEYVRETYRSDGAIGSRTVWDGMNGTGASYTATFQFYSAPDREETQLPRANFIREYLIAGAGLLTRQVRSDGTNEKMTEQYTYETVQDWRVVRTATNAYGGLTDYLYDGNGLLTHRQDPVVGDLGATTGPTLKRSEVKYFYDAWQQLTKERRLIASAVWVDTEYEYDSKGRMTRQIEDEGTTGTLNLTTSYEYNPFNQQTRTVDPRGVVHYMLYCPSGQLTQEYTLRDLNASSGPALEETQYEYDAAGRQTLVKAADDDVAFTAGSPADWFLTKYEYDLYGRRTRMIVENTLTTDYEYDNQDRITKTTTPGGVWTKIERNGRGLQTAEVIGYAGNEVLRKTFAYDANGNLTTATEPSGRDTIYEYDLFDRVTKVTKE